MLVLIDEKQNVERSMYFCASPPVVPLTIEAPADEPRARLMIARILLKCRSSSASASSNNTGLASCPSSWRMPASVVLLSTRKLIDPSALPITSSMIVVLPEPAGPQIQMCGRHFKIPHTGDTTNHPASNLPESERSHVRLSQMSTSACVSSVAAMRLISRSIGMSAGYT